MNSVEILDDCFRNMFDMPPAKERPVNPPDEPIVSNDIAEKKLRKSLTAQKRSEYWDDFTMYLFDEISDQEADKVSAALLEGEYLVVGEVLAAVKERAIRKTAERFANQLGSMS